MGTLQLFQISFSSNGDWKESIRQGMTYIGQMEIRLKLFISLFYFF